MVNLIQGESHFIINQIRWCNHCLLVVPEISHLCMEYRYKKFIQWPIIASKAHQYAVWQYRRIEQRRSQNEGMTCSNWRKRSDPAIFTNNKTPLKDATWLKKRHREDHRTENDFVAMWARRRDEVKALTRGGKGDIYCTYANRSPPCRLPMHQLG